LGAKKLLKVKTSTYKTLHGNSELAGYCGGKKTVTNIHIPKILENLIT
jgi:hypothetical protein